MNEPASNFFRAFAALTLSLLAACSTTSPPKNSAPYSPLILISLDGFRADYLDRGLTPTLRALADDGVHAAALKPAFPTLTFPNHYTIVTGLYPDHHGIVNNRFVDPVTQHKFVYKDQSSIADPSWWGGEPIWVGAERQGKRAATMFWPGSDVAIDHVRPTYWAAFNAKVTPDERVDRVLGWLDLPPGERPDFITLYIETADHAGHDHGPDSHDVDAALGELDHSMSRLVDGLKRRELFATANLVIVSDHGMTSTSPDHIVVIDDVVNIDDVDVVNSGVLAGIAAKPGRAPHVESALLRAHDHMHCWRKSEIPARLHYGSNPRIPPYVCLADDGWLIDTRSYLNGPNRHISRGEHGYDNDDPNMRALFIAHGPAFRRGLVFPEFDNVDIYPLLAEVLHIRPAANNGRLDDVRGMLQSP